MSELLAAIIVTVSLFALFSWAVVAVSILALFITEKAKGLATWKHLGPAIVIIATAPLSMPLIAYTLATKDFQQAAANTQKP